MADQVYEDQISIDKVTMHTISSIKKDDHMQFRNYVEKDQIIEAWMMEKPDSVKGEQVKAIIKKAKITLTLDAHLLENGYIGNNIKVALSKNNKVLLGTLHDKKTVIISGCSLLILAPAGYADSLWTSATAPSIFDNQRSFNIGDLVTVMISAESTAVQEAGTTTRKQSDIGAKFFDTFDQYSLDTDGNKSNRKMQDYRIGGDDNYSGVGQTTRKSKVEAIVSCIITRILPNGNLVISGERLVDVNNDSEIIQISGIVRPADIDTKNRIESHQIAQFNISLKGKVL